MAYKTYRVKKNSSYPSIAQELKVPVSTLVNLNQQAPLSAGMQIRVPSAYGTGGKTGQFGIGGPQFSTVVPSSLPAPVIQPIAPPKLPVQSNGNFVNPPQGLFGTPSTNFMTAPAPTTSQAFFQTPTTGTGSGYPVGQNPLAAPVVSNKPAPVHGPFGGFKNPNGGEDVYFWTLREARLYQRRRHPANYNRGGDTGGGTGTDSNNNNTQAVTWRVGG